MRITRSQIRKLIKEQMEAAPENSFHEKLRNFANSISAKGYTVNLLDDVVNPGQSLKINITLQRDGAYFLVAPVDATTKMQIKYLAGLAGIRLKHVQKNDFYLTDESVESPELVMKGKITKLKNILKKAGFQPYKAKHMPNFRGEKTINASSGDYVLKPRYFHENTYELWLKTHMNYGLKHAIMKSSTRL